MGKWKVINPNGKEYAGDRLVKLCLDAQREYIGDEEFIRRAKKGLEPDPNFPVVVCLCGSTRFWREFQRASLRETMAGKIVLSIGAATGTDDEHFGNLPQDEYDQVKSMLDELHLRKIDIADEVLILNVGGYIGESTRSELEYAQKAGKIVRYLETDNQQLHPING